jgi:putative inorganic carbon (HCO3(-)) transporter
MSAHGARTPASAGRLAAAAAVAAAGGLVGYLLLVRAADGGAVDALAVGLGIGAVAVAILRPELAAAFLPAIVFANAGLVLADTYGAPNVVSGLALIVLGALLATPAWRSQVLRATPVLLSFCAYAGILVLSTVQAPGPADVGTVAQDVLIGLAIVLVVTAVASRDGGLRHSAELIVAAAAVLAGLTLVKQLGVGGTWFGFATDNAPTAEQVALQGRAGFRIEGDASRATGPLGDANFWAQSLVLALPLALWSIRRGPTVATRWCAAGAAALTGAGIVVTQSRGGAIALVIAVAVWLWLQGGRYRLAILVLPVLVVLALALTGSTERFQELRNVDDASQSTAFRGRLSENIAALEMWQDHPVLGVGVNEFPRNYRSYAARIGLDSRSERNAHNSYLQQAAESGTLGFVAFLAMIAAGFWCGIRARARLLAQGDVSAAGVCEGLIAGLVGYCCAAVLLHQAFPQYLWMWISLMAGAYLLSGYRMRGLLGQRG